MSHPLINIAVTAARKAGTLIVRALDRPETLKISAKGENDFVTEIDHLAEKAIIEIIQKNYPSHGILGEESGYIKGDDHTWIIDPIDGTTNFIHGFPHFAISIAIQYKDKIEHGVIYDPVRQELFTATRGQGAKLNQYRMRVTQTMQLQHALLGTGFPYKQMDHLETYLKEFGAFTRQVAGIRRAGSAALDMAYVAAGRLDGFWERGLAKWDIAAGSLLILEAGGLLAEPNGESNYLESGNVVAASPKVLEAMLKVIANV